MISCFMQQLRSEAAEDCGEVAPLDSGSCGSDNNSQLRGENIGVAACATVGASLNCNYGIACVGQAEVQCFLSALCAAVLGDNEVLRVHPSRPRAYSLQP